ncbi:MAG: NifU family protein [Actinobacteria bacterium]|nr:NifU family protein [Actinomycetota bacterium]
MVDQLLTITDEAMKMVQEARNAENDADSLALWIEIIGSRGNAYDYDLYFQSMEDASPSDVLISSDGSSGVPVVIPAPSVELIRGSRLEWSDDGEGGLVMINPNTPAGDNGLPEGVVEGDFSSPVAQRILEVIDEDINRAIASHGGYAELVAVGDGVAYVRMMGGCQGCGLASVTLSQGIEVAIKNAVPEIRRVADVTNHNAGTNPFYQASAK